MISRIASGRMGQDRTRLLILQHGHEIWREERQLVFFENQRFVSARARARKILTFSYEQYIPLLVESENLGCAKAPGVEGA